MDTTSLQDKIAKIYELANKGGTDGEKAAAKASIDRLLRKYNLKDDYVKNAKKIVFSIKYSTNLDLFLFNTLVDYFFPNKEYQGYRSAIHNKHISIEMEYIDFIQLDCAYAYFKMDMGKKFKTECHPIISKCRTNKTKNKRRVELQNEFFSNYIARLLWSS